MRERAGEIGGTLAIVDERAGGGTDGRSGRAHGAASTIGHDVDAPGSASSASTIIASCAKASRCIIGRQPDMEVVGDRPRPAKRPSTLFRRHRPDVTLMDLQLRRDERRRSHPRDPRASDPTARIVVLTMYQGDEDIYRALEAGAATYLLKDTLSDDLVRVVREVHAGGHPMRAGCRGAARRARRRSRR